MVIDLLGFSLLALAEYHVTVTVYRPEEPLLPAVEA